MYQSHVTHLRKVNTVLLTTLSLYCDYSGLQVKSIKDAYDRRIVAEMYDNFTLTVSLISAEEVEVETWCPDTKSRTSEKLEI